MGHCSGRGHLHFGRESDDLNTALAPSIKVMEFSDELDDELSDEDASVGCVASYSACSAAVTVPSSFKFCRISIGAAAAAEMGVRRKWWQESAEAA